MEQWRIVAAATSLILQGRQEVAAEDGVKVVVDTVAAEHEVLAETAFAVEAELL